MHGPGLLGTSAVVFHVRHLHMLEYIFCSLRNNMV